MIKPLYKATKTLRGSVIDTIHEKVIGKIRSEGIGTPCEDTINDRIAMWLIHAYYETDFATHDAITDVFLRK